ncbi:MAG: FAD-dependent oxidoreductase [Rubrivivax sp.]|nr:FAD-dependent oxidoreductase [Rubrivivax sp.]
MRIVVIGAGIVGLASAHFLRAEGVRDIVVVDAASGPGQGTSYANGALLHPSAVEPWNSPGILGYLIRHLGREDAAVLLRARALPSLVFWGLRFLRESSPARFRANAMANTALAMDSMQCLRDMGADAWDFNHTRKGSLTVLRDARALDESANWAATLSQAGVRHRVLDRAGLLAVEPALAPIAGELAGAIHNLDDETGDCHRFCVALAASLASAGVQLRWNTRVERIDADRGRVRGVHLAGGVRIDADEVVLAAGPHSVALAAAVGLRLPIRPAKGYSLTYTLDSDAPGPSHPVIDRALHVALTPLGEGGTRRLRVAGTAEFCGHDLRIAQGRVNHLAGLATRLYPEVLRRPAVEAPRVWAGLRPVCADGRPLIGATRIGGLWLNTGHGHLGWTVGPGSGRLLALQMKQQLPSEVNAEAFSPARFGL